MILAESATDMPHYNVRLVTLPYLPVGNGKISLDKGGISDYLDNT